MKDHSQMSVESYAHKAAKEIFAGWLRELAAHACEKTSGDPLNAAGNPSVDFCGLYWRVNRDGPHFGVWTEYPIGRDANDSAQNGRVWSARDGIDPVWDEEWTGYEGGCKWEERPPTYEELVAEGRPPEFIADIAIQHKGAIIAVIEIVHKNPPGERKIRSFNRMEVSTLVVPAAWVLGQVGMPKSIPSGFWS